MTNYLYKSVFGEKAILFILDSPFDLIGSKVKTVTAKQKQLIETLSQGSCNMHDLLQQLGISERTLWRYKKALAEQGYNLIINKDTCRLIPKGWLGDVGSKCAEDTDVRRFAILRLLSESPLDAVEINHKIKQRFEIKDSTIKNDLRRLQQQSVVREENGKYTLGEAMLGELELSQEEGSRLLSYLVIKQQIEGKNALYNSLVHSLANSVGRNSWFSWQQARRTTQRICIKGKHQDLEMRERAMAERLELASWEEQVVEILYHRERRMVEPLGVIYSYHQDAWYLHAFCQKANARRTFRLDQIEEFQVLEEKFSYPSNFELEDNFAYSWGIMVDEPPVEVRIKFFDDYNVLSRLSREVAERQRAKITPLDDGSILYEDLVVGMEEFKVWIRSFGSSAQILEPEALRENLLASVRAALARYGEVGN